ncbi:MAG: molybdate ABC transporter substrate-binding protein [Alphaproteobacteria bacterium]|nr:molybdate ABC transporter substrate-binding protein [Alphaproteobacteria bacterium]
MHRRLMLVLAALPCATVRASVVDRPLIAAAASLQPALEEAAPLIGAQTGTAPRFTYGASGNLARQIAQGAPFEMLLAADEISIQKISEAGQTRDAGHVFALGRLALFAPRGSALDPAAGLEALRPLLAAGRVRRFAIANPETAPYGRAAEQALLSLELWEALRLRLVFGENIAQAAQFAMTEGASGGLVAYSLALSPALKVRGSYSLVPANLHEPLGHHLVLTRRASDAAARLQAWFLSPKAAAVFARHGLEKP